MIGRLVRLAVVATLGGWFVNGWLAGRGTAAGQSVPPPVETLIVIDAPIEPVWGQISDIRSQPRWMADMKSVRLTTADPLGVGSRGVAIVRILGISVRDPVTITAFDPPRHFAVEHEGRFKGRGVIRLEAGADGSTTIVRWAETITPPVLPWLGAAMLRPILGHVFQTDLARLKAIIEAEPLGG